MFKQLFNTDYEEALIGAILIDPEPFPEISTRLAPADFHDIRHQIAWEACRDLHAQELPIGLFTLTNRLEEKDLLETAGGSAYLTGLLYAPASSLDARGYARKVEELSRRRKKLALADRMAKEAVNFDIPVELDLQVAPRFVVHSAAEALLPRPPIPWVVDQVVQQGSLNMFFGDSGSRKTYSMLDMGICAAAGQPWLGFETRPCRVLYIDEESGEQPLADRIAKCLRGHLLGAETSFEYVSLSGLNLNDAADAVLLQALIAERGAGLVFLDALCDLTTGDENSKKEMQPVFTRLRRIVEETGAAVNLVHHTNKQGGYRGQTAIKAALNGMYRVDSDDGSPYINFKSEKVREGVAVQWHARAHWVASDPPQFYLEEAVPQKKEKDLTRSQNYVLDYLKEHGASPMPVIMSSPGVCGSDAIKKAVYALKRMGRVCRTNPGQNGPGIAGIFDLVRTINSGVENG